MRPTPTAVGQSLSARIQVKTYPFNPISSKIGVFSLDEMSPLSVVNYTFLSLCQRDK
jgi:hypothetical protein